MDLDALFNINQHLSHKERAKHKKCVEFIESLNWDSRGDASPFDDKFYLEPRKIFETCPSEVKGATYLRIVQTYNSSTLIAQETMIAHGFIPSSMTFWHQCKTYLASKLRYSGEEATRAIANYEAECQHQGLPRRCINCEERHIRCSFRDVPSFGKPCASCRWDGYRRITCRQFGYHTSRHTSDLSHSSPRLPSHLFSSEITNSDPTQSQGVRNWTGNQRSESIGHQYNRRVSASSKDQVFQTKLSGSQEDEIEKFCDSDIVAQEYGHEKPDEKKGVRSKGTGHEGEGGSRVTRSREDAPNEEQDDHEAKRNRVSKQGDVVPVSLRNKSIQMTASAEDGNVRTDLQDEEVQMIEPAKLEDIPTNPQDDNVQITDPPANKGFHTNTEDESIRSNSETAKDDDARSDTADLGDMEDDWTRLYSWEEVEKIWDEYFGTTDAGKRERAIFSTDTEPAEP